MTHTNRFFVLIGLMLISVFASYGQADRIQLALEDGNLKRALKLAETSMEDPELKKDPYVYYASAEAYLAIYNDEYLSTKYPEALKLGIKALDKGRRKNDGEHFDEYLELVDKYVAENNKEAADQYKINKFTKAIKFYETSFDLNGDMFAYFWMGKCYLLSEDTLMGEEHYSRSIVWANETNIKGIAVDSTLSEAYIYYADKYWGQQKYDSANLYLESARKVFGGNPRIDYFQKEVTKEQINQLPPSSLMMEKIKYILGYFPLDTFFLKKENALYLYLLRNTYSNQDSASLDTMLARFAAEKVERGNSELVNQYKKSDQFVEAKTENVWWKLVKYYSKFDHPDISNYIAHKYIVATAKGNDKESIAARYAVIIDYAAKSHSLKLANQLLELFEARGGSQDAIGSLRESLISKNADRDLNLDDMGAFYALITTQHSNLASLPEDVIKFTDKYIDALIKAKEYRKARVIIYAHGAAQPDEPLWTRKKEYLAKEDFYYSFYMTRVKDEVVAGMKVNGYTWDGSTANCEPGTVPAEIQQKVEDRINYFRRQAGVPDIYLDPELNDWCQKTALMMEANKSLSHVPDSRWRCYTDEGAHAARYSLLTKGATTTMAVTSFIADNQNKNVGNRRWLLYPNGLALGHGSTENACVIWASDDSGSVDTNLFKDQFIAWPPEGYIPEMMVFKNWSFSIDQDLEGATVRMLKNGSELPIEVYEYESGHRLPTLVWDPLVEVEEYRGETVTIVVDLKNGRRYKYDVRPFMFDPVGY